jgi:hypothetical protein
MRLTTLRGRLPNSLIFAFEGDDDKIVYSRWIGRLRPSMVYEPFVCNGKGGVIQLKEIVRRDLADIGRGLYYFVDRDFDDLEGFPDVEGVYMTDRYAVENYLVSSEVLDAALRDEFPCHEQPALRAEICLLFENTYEQFLSATAAANRRLYYARRIPVDLIKPLPTKIAALAQVAIDHVVPSPTPASELVTLSREPLESETASLEEEFQALNPGARYRGKFAYLFFKRWLDLLCDEYETRASGTFGNLAAKSKVRRAELCLGGFASKSPLPAGLQDFLEAVPPLNS